MQRGGPFPVGIQFGIAHRGGGGEAAENSATAFQHSWDLGLRFVETDVRATVDGHAVVFHDPGLERTTDAAGPVAELPLAEVQRARQASGDHPMTLRHALRRWSGLRLNVDVKCDDAVLPFLRAVDEAQAWHRVCAASFSSARLRRLRRLAGPRLATSLGTAEVVGLAVHGPVRAGPCAAQVPLRAGLVPVVTRPLLRRAHALGLGVHVWTVDDRAVMVRLLDMGVDAIISDRPSVLCDVLAARGLPLDPT